MPRPKIARVIGIHAICDGSKTALARQYIKLSEKFILAVIAAVRIIRDIERILRFARFDPFVADSMILHKRRSHAAIVCRITRRKRRHRKCTFAERLWQRPKPSMQNLRRPKTR